MTFEAIHVLTQEAAIGLRQVRAMAGRFGLEGELFRSAEEYIAKGLMPLGRQLLVLPEKDYSHHVAAFRPLHHKIVIQSNLSREVLGLAQLVQQKIALDALPLEVAIFALRQKEFCSLLSHMLGWGGLEHSETWQGPLTAKAPYFKKILAGHRELLARHEHFCRAMAALESSQFGKISMITVASDGVRFVWRAIGQFAFTAPNELIPIPLHMVWDLRRAADHEAFGFFDLTRTEDDFFDVLVLRSMKDE